MTTLRSIPLLSLLVLMACPAADTDPTDADPTDTDPVDPVACIGEGAADSALPDQDTCNSDPGITLGAAITDPEAIGKPHHIRFADTQCMNGVGAEANSGITLKIQPGAKRLVVYLQGGGLCVDDLTCAGVRNPNGLPTDVDTLLTRDWILEGGTLFRDPPFDDAHQVFVHYCSGDFHAGQQSRPVSAPGTAVDGRVYTGRANMAAFLSRLVPTFGEGGPHAVDEVVLTGSSAGGFGTLMNYAFVQQAFGCTPVHAFIDSAPPLSDDIVLPCYQEDWAGLLNVDASVPADCPDCLFKDGQADNLLPHLVGAYPGRRFGWYSSTQDCVLRQLVSVPSPSCAPTPAAPTGDAFAGALRDIRQDLADEANFRMFLYPGDWHTVPIPPAGLGDAIKGPDAQSDRRLRDIEAGGVNLEAWLSGLVDADEPWSHACEPDRAARDELTTCE
ncbi:MAG: pectin acetylesterase-family hydrolase [Myxococcota bacterium]